MKRRTKAEAAAFREQQARGVAERNAATLARRAREQAEEAARKLAKAQVKLDLVTDRYAAIFKVIEGAIEMQALLGELPEKRISNWGRDIASSIKDLPTTYSGFISKKALAKMYEHYKNGDKRYYPTSEHYNPNQVMGVRIIRHFLKKGFIEGNILNVDKELQEFLHEATFVHHVTYQENLDLRRHQKESIFTTWQDAYNSCGIGELLEWPKGLHIADIPTRYPELT